MKNQSGQVIIILLLTMLVALAIGLTVTQRSLSDVATSNQTEQSSRAFSAAEAGLEQAISLTSPGSSVSVGNLGNEASANVAVNPNLPIGNEGIEYPPIGKETVAQVWLARPEDITAPAYNFSTGPLNLYFGTSTETNPDEIPAIEVSIIMWNATTNVYTTVKRFYDPISSRRSSNNFTDPGCGGPSMTDTIYGTNRSFRCRVNMEMGPIVPAGNKPILLRTRFLYTTKKHPVVVQAQPPRVLPPQVSLYSSTGIAGQSQRTVTLFRLKYVVPQFFDFAIFSSAEINKN